MRGSKEDLPVALEVGEEARSCQTQWGDMNVAYEVGPDIHRATEMLGRDPTGLFEGLPDDRCQCPHWGYLTKGRIRVKYADREEVINAGDVYYMAPGHIPIPEEATELVEFSPKGEYQKTMEVVARNMGTASQDH